MVEEDAVALTRALVEIDSRNPTLSPDAPGERPVALALGKILDAWGFSVSVSESDRPNLTARLGPADAPAMMFAGHLDTVGVEGMTHDPFSGIIEDGKLYGRGSCDMKSGVAAMCVAALRAWRSAGDSATRQIIIAAVSDEEYESLGMRALLAAAPTLSIIVGLRNRRSLHAGKWYVLRAGQHLGLLAGALYNIRPRPKLWQPRRDVRQLCMCFPMCR